MELDIFKGRTHYMLDLETLGTEAGYVILSYGIVAFIGTEEGLAITDKLEGYFNYEESTKNFKIEKNTYEWWFNTNYELLRSIIGKCNNLISIKEELNTISSFIEQNEYSIQGKLWGNSEEFDCSILNHYFRYYDIPFPIKHYNLLSFRNIKQQYPELIKDVEIEGNKHDALVDAIHQVNQLNKVYQYWLTK